MEPLYLCRGNPAKREEVLFLIYRQGFSDSYIGFFCAQKEWTRDWPRMYVFVTLVLKECHLTQKWRSLDVCVLFSCWMNDGLHFWLLMVCDLLFWKMEFINGWNEFRYIFWKDDFDSEWVERIKRRLSVKRILEKESFIFYAMLYIWGEFKFLAQ